MYHTGKVVGSSQIRDGEGGGEKSVLNKKGKQYNEKFQNLLNLVLHTCPSPSPLNFYGDLR